MEPLVWWYAIHGQLDFPVWSMVNSMNVVTHSNVYVSELKVTLSDSSKQISSNCPLVIFYWITHTLSGKIIHLIRPIGLEQHIPSFWYQTHHHRIPTDCPYKHMGQSYPLGLALVYILVISQHDISMRKLQNTNL